LVTSIIARIVVVGTRSLAFQPVASNFTI
jgi:hypothetical protein